MLFVCLIPGTVNEENFLNGCLKLPQPLLEEVLNFELLPSHMRQELHNKLPEVKIRSYLAPVLKPVWLSHMISKLSASISEIYFCQPCISYQNMTHMPWLFTHISWWTLTDGYRQKNPKWLWWIGSFDPCVFDTLFFYHLTHITEHLNFYLFTALKINLKI